MKFGIFGFAATIALLGVETAIANPISVSWADRGGWRESNPFDNPLFDDGRLVDRSVFFAVQASADNLPQTSGNAWRMGLEFDLSSISRPGIQSAMFIFETGRTQIGDATVEIHTFAGNGIAERTDVLVDDFVQRIIVPETRDDIVTWTIDVRNILNRTLAMNDSYVGFSLRISNDLGLDSGNFGTSVYAPLPDSPEADLFEGPRLEIVQIPGPSTISLLGIGLAAVGLARRRRMGCR